MVRFWLSILIWWKLAAFSNERRRSGSLIEKKRLSLSAFSGTWRAITGPTRANSERSSPQETLIAVRPPSRRTRKNSASPLAGSLKNISPNWQITASKCLSR